LFHLRLLEIIDMNHALVKLARSLDWRVMEEKFGTVYRDGSGRSLRHAAMAQLAILKHA